MIKPALEIDDCELDTKDVFWHSKNVTVRDSIVKGEYLGWFSENLTLINCRIIGTQLLCYCKNLKLVNCIMEDTDLSFEYSDVEADVKGHIISVKNPKSGRILADSVGEIIRGDSVMEGWSIMDNMEWCEGYGPRFGLIHVDYETQKLVGVDDKTREVVGVDDDRLEVTSPGGLYNGLTYEELMNGHSKLRNRAIANVLGQMGLVESWGTGIKRIMKAAEEYGLPAPEFQVFDDMFRVSLFRNHSLMNEQNNIGEASEKHRRSIGETSEKHRRNIGETSENLCSLNGKDWSDTQRKILSLLSRDAQLSASKMAEQIGISRRNIESNIKKLKEQGILIRHGSPKNGYWEVIDGYGVMGGIKKKNEIEGM